MSIINTKKNISLKKHVKMSNLISFLDKSSYIFVLNDLSLNAQQSLLNFQKDKNVNKIFKSVVKSKLLIKILIEKGILHEDYNFIKGPILLIGVNDVNTFKNFLKFVNHTSNNLDLIFVLINNFIINRADINNIFINFFKDLNFFQYANCLNIKYKKEILNSLLFSTYFIESKLIKAFKLN